MTEISLARLDMTEFSHSAEDMLPSSDKKILFEGKVNKKYYQKINHFRKYTLENGDSCSNIKKRVSNNSLLYGVIDGDFIEEDLDKIYQIDFYSIENIVLLNHHALDSQLNVLRNDLKQYFNKEKTIRHRLVQDETNKNRFVLKKDLEIDSKFHPYIDSKIIDQDSFLRYMDLKKVVNSYMNVIKQGKKNSKETKKIIKKYIETCNIISIEELFSKSELSRVQKEL